MSALKILLIGVFMIMAVMVITAMIHLIAPYVAVLAVVVLAIWLVMRPEEKPPDKIDPNPD